MASIRQGYFDDYTQKDQKVGIGTSTSQEKLQIVGDVMSTGLSATGIATLTSASGFIERNLEYVENVDIDAGDSATLSGEIIVGAGLTMTVGTGATAGQGNIDSLKVYSMFQPPTGGTNQRPVGKPGSLFYNTDFKTVEFFDGNSWRQVDNVTTRGRGLFGGGQPGPSKKIDSVEIMSQGNGVDFGDLISARSNKGGYSSNIRGVFIGGSGVDEMDYVTIASRGDGIDFGNLSQARGYSPGTSSSTRGLCLGGWQGSNPPSNIIDFVEIVTLGDALDFGDLFTGRYSHSCFSSPTRAFAYTGSNNNNGTIEGSIEMVTIAAKGNGTDFGEPIIAGNYHQNGCSSTVRGLVAGGGGPAVTTSIQSVVMASSGSSEIGGDLTVARQRPGAASTEIRAVFYGGRSNGGATLNTIDYVSISSLGSAQDFGDISDNNYTKAGLSDSHGGLGGF